MAQAVSLPMGKLALQLDNKSRGNVCGVVSRALITSTVPRRKKREMHDVVFLKQVNITPESAVALHVPLAQS